MKPYRIVLGVAAAALLLFMIVLAGAAVVTSSQASAACQQQGTPVSSPGADVRSMGQIVAYFESQQIQPNAAAGIVGNLMQENSLDPSGAGIAQWGGAWFTDMVAWVTGQGLSATSLQGQLAYIVYNLRTNAGGHIREPGLLAKLNAAPDAATAATMFETGYEACSGVQGWMVVTVPSLCNDPRRKAEAGLALQASGGAPVTLLAVSPCGSPLGPDAAMKILAMAIGAEGGGYSQFNHATAFLDSPTELAAAGTDCSGYVSWLMGPEGLAVWPAPLATPGIPAAPDLQAGQGQYVTVWNNPLPGTAGHVWIVIMGRAFESAGGVGIHEMSSGEVRMYQAQGVYVPFHPVGL